MRKTKFPRTKTVKKNLKARPETKAFIDTYELPSSYNDTNLTLIPRDPRSLHAYWEIAPFSLEALRAKLGGDFEKSSRTLRMYDVTRVNFNGNNANSWFDIDVGCRANNWYLNVWRDNVAYCGEIGLKAPDGRFFPLTKSNFVNTPRQNPSERSDLIWMEVKNEPKNERPFVFAEVKQGSKNSDSAARDVKYNKPQSAKSNRRKVYLTEDDIRAYYSKLFPLLRIVTRRSKSLKGRYGIPGGNGILIESAISSKGKFLKKLLLGSSEELIVEGQAASEMIHAGASERIEKKRKFFFEIGTELIVYGRTEPDAEVTLEGKRMELRKDGTFTLRFALPDGGKIPLNFTARSRDKVDKKDIATSVTREKTKSS